MKFRFLLPVLAAFSTLAIHSSAQAFVEIKAGYSLLNANPTKFNDLNPLTEPVKGLQGVTADLLLNAAIMPINLGARYEKFTFKKGTGVATSDIEYERISVLLNKRFIDSVGYLGFVATVGVSNEFRDNIAKTKASSSLSGSVGLETGVKLGFLMFGIEGGYLVAPLGDLKDSSGATVLVAGSPVEVDMSGGYGRAVVGFNF